MNEVKIVQKMRPIEYNDKNGLENQSENFSELVYSETGEPVPDGTYIITQNGKNIMCTIHGYRLMFGEAIKQTSPIFILEKIR